MAKLLHIDPFHGASGDMFLGAFFDLGVESNEVKALLGTLKLPAWDWTLRRVDRSGLDCQKVDFIIGGKEERSHRKLPEIIHLLSESELPEPVMELAIRAFQALAVAEGKVHGISPDEVEFHEVGAVDSILDIVGSAICYHLLGAPVCTCSPVALGSGTVHTSHGEYPVPAPAVLELLKGIPVTSGGVNAELTTPTGAALIVTLAQEFTPMPPAQPLVVGMGAGSREDAEGVNALRLILAEEMEQHRQNEVVEISCNLDDLPPFAFMPVYEALFAAGALDVWVTPIVMKKGRPGYQLTVMAAPNLSQEIALIVMDHTTSLGVRIRRVDRIVLDRDEAVIATPWGDCRVKVGYLEGEIKQVLPEYDDVHRMAQEAGLPFTEVYGQCFMMARQALYPDDGLDE
jgi:uncharacterized protein (TIGR00299 family) protein